LRIEALSFSALPQHHSALVYYYTESAPIENPAISLYRARRDDNPERLEEILQVMKDDLKVSISLGYQF
jgi:hypothetical protein